MRESVKQIQTMNIGLDFHLTIGEGKGERMGVEEGWQWGRNLSD